MATIALSDPGLQRLQDRLLREALAVDESVWGSLYVRLSSMLTRAAAMRAVRTVELLAAGFSEAETAARVGCSVRTVRRDRRLARSAFESRRECCV